MVDIGSNYSLTSLNTHRARKSSTAPMSSVWNQVSKLWWRKTDLVPVDDMWLHAPWRPGIQTIRIIDIVKNKLGRLEMVWLTQNRSKLSQWRPWPRTLDYRSSLRSKILFRFFCLRKRLKRKLNRIARSSPNCLRTSPNLQQGWGPGKPYFPAGTCG